MRKVRPAKLINLFKNTQASKRWSQDPKLPPGSPPHLMNKKAVYQKTHKQSTDRQGDNQEGLGNIHGALAGGRSPGQGNTPGSPNYC